MSKVLETNNNRVKCQKFTTPELVDTMLELAQYSGDLYGKCILENSFGSGNILEAIVSKYIEEAFAHNYTRAQISEGLGRDIYGIELDKGLYEACIKKLDSITDKLGLPQVTWQLFNDDALSFNYPVKFDYIIGNPPYISYKELDKESRKQLRERFESCKAGKFDYCYAFIELGINLLSEFGKLVQLVPNNIYKNVFATKLRALLGHHVTAIYDYPEQKLFGETLTSISIFCYDVSCKSDCFQYANMTAGSHIVFDRKTLGEKWVFANHQENKKKNIRFGDYYSASISVATLLNNAYLVSEEQSNIEKLESAVLRDAASPRYLREKKTYKIIFPYSVDNGQLKRYTEDSFKEQCPNAYNHLEQFIDALAKRDSDSSAHWFEYGRSQALAHINKEKLLLSTIITKKVEVYALDAQTIPFSGIYITAKSPTHSLDEAKRMLTSPQFLEYVKGIGIKISGTSLRITCRDVNDFEYYPEDEDA